MKDTVKTHEAAAMVGMPVPEFQWLYLRGEFVPALPQKAVPHPKVRGLTEVPEMRWRRADVEAWLAERDK